MAVLINAIIQLYSLLIVARVVMSWVQVDPYHPVADFIFKTTEPVLKPVRDFLPPMSGLDLSPIVVIIGLELIGGILVQGLS